MKIFEFIPEAISIAMSLVATVMAYLAFRLSQQAVSIQTYMRYFESNNFQLDNWEIVSTLTPLGKSASRQEAVIKVYLLHRLNRFRWDNDRRQKKMHKIYAKAIFGSNLSEFQKILVKQGANKKSAKSAAQILTAIRFDDPNFSFDHRFWNEYFGAKYFEQSNNTQSA